MMAWCPILLAMALASQSGVSAEVKLTQTYRDSRTGLTIHFPAGWILDHEAPGFAIVDFPPDKRPPQVFVPMDRAEIGVLSPPEGEKSIREWMRGERINEGQGFRISQSRLRTKGFGVLDVTVARDEPTVMPSGTILLFFFEVKGRPIKASLSYRGRRQAARFESIFNSIIQNLEPSPVR